MAQHWDAEEWAKRFGEASRTRNGYELRRLRADVFQTTAAAVRAREYWHAGDHVSLDRDDHYERLHTATRFHSSTDELKVPEARRRQHRTRVEVRDADCLEVAREFGEAGEAPAVLNMASRRNPGGGVLNGAGAQEESLFRRSNLLHSLYQFVEYGCDYDVPPSPDGHGYPIPRESGGIYTPPAFVFRASASRGYAFLPEPYAAAFVTVPAISGPDVYTVDGELRLTDRMAEATRRKIRAIFRTAHHHGHADLVLSAFGCGAFRNPPGHMAILFRETLAEPEFEGVFRRVTFSVIDDHNAGRDHNREGNFVPFARELAALASTWKSS